MDWKNVVATISPWIGTALGGPLGGMAVTAVADALGLSDKTEGAIKQALSGATPEQMLNLKKADQDFALKMKELGFANLKDMEQIAVNDRDSARKREMEVKDNTPKILAYAMTIGFFSILTFMLFKAVPLESRDLLNIMLGMLGTSFVSVISYYFGSTAGSSEKTRLLAATKEQSKD
jgi:hypothetical protein